MARKALHIRRSRERAAMTVAEQDARLAYMACKSKSGKAKQKALEQVKEYLFKRNPMVGHPTEHIESLTDKE